MKDARKKKIRAIPDSGAGRLAGKVRAFHILAEAAAGLTESLAVAARAVHGREELSDPRRGILMAISRHGPMTIPALARGRGVSRQNVRIIVLALVAEGFMRFGDNPGHKRSALLSLTSSGDALARAMSEKETAIYRKVAPDITAERMLDAAGTLRQVERILNGEKMKRLVKGP